MREEFEGHEPDPSALNKNDYRWINEFFETEGYLAESRKTESHTSFEKENWYHPNKIGHERNGKHPDPQGWRTLLRADDSGSDTQ